VVRVLDPEDVARELDDRVLKASSGPDERDPALAGEAYGGEGTLHAAVRARGRDEDPPVAGEPFFRPVGPNLGRRHPLEGDAGMPEPRVRRLMRVVQRVEVSDDTHG
jgi:hypothetical protein